MKKFIAFLMAALMCLSVFTACTPAETKNEDLEAAIKYISAMYKDRGTVTANDFTVVPQVVIAGTVFKIEWTVDHESVKVVPGTDEITIDVTEKNPEEVKYKLTATVKDAEGNTASHTFEYTVPAFNGYESIVNDAYALKPGESLEGSFTLEGVVLTIDTAFDPGYNNVTVTIQIGNMTDKPIQCYRLKGDGADKIKIGDTITVTGELTNYNGKIEFNQGCVLDKLVAGNVEQPKLPEVPENATMEQIVDAAYNLISGQKFEVAYTLTGVITSIDKAFDPSYGNVSVVIQVGDKADKLILCHRLKGDGADIINVGDTITATGYIKNYNGIIEFDAGCTLDSYTKAEGGSSEKPSEKPSEQPSQKPSETEKPGNDNPGGNDEPSTPDVPKTPAEILAATESLKDGEYLGGSQDSHWKLSGVITKIEGTWNSKYGNMPVTIEVDGANGKTIYCYGVTCAEDDQFKVGEKITVEGCIKNYGGLIEFWCPTLVDRDKSGAVEDPSGNDTPANPTTQKEIVDAAFALGAGETLAGGPYTLTGAIVSFKVQPQLSTYDGGTDWEAQLTITVEGKDILCFWLKGTEAQMKDLKVGDTITVTGTIKNYNGTVEFDRPRIQ